MAISDEERAKRIFRALGVILLVIGGILLAVSYSESHTLIEFHNYKFRINSYSSEEVALREFQIFYDFVHHKGQIYYQLINTNSTSLFIYYLPKEVKVTSINWTDRRGESESNYTIYKQNSDYVIRTDKNPPPNNNLIYIVEGINNSEKSYWSTVILNFEGVLYPNAEFEFTPDGGKFSPPFSDENGAFFKFYLGNTFSCADPCYESFRPEELVFHYRDNKLTVSTVKEPQGWKDIGYHIFTLNYNKKNNDLSSILKDISLILISLGIAPFIEYVILKAIKVNRKHKRSGR